MVDADGIAPGIRTKRVPHVGHPAPPPPRRVAAHPARACRVTRRGRAHGPGVDVAPGVGAGAGWVTRPGVAGCRCAHPCRPSGTTARSYGGMATARSWGGVATACSDGGDGVANCPAARGGESRTAGTGRRRGATGSRVRRGGGGAGGVRPQWLARPRRGDLWPTDFAPFRGRTPPGATPTHPPDPRRYAHPHRTRTGAAGTPRHRRRHPHPGGPVRHTRAPYAEFV